MPSIWGDVGCNVITKQLTTFEFRRTNSQQFCCFATAEQFSLAPKSKKGISVQGLSVRFATRVLSCVKTSIHTLKVAEWSKERKVEPGLITRLWTGINRFSTGCKKSGCLYESHCRYPGKGCTLTGPTPACSGVRHSPNRYRQ